MEKTKCSKKVRHLWKIYKGSVVQDIFEKPGTKSLLYHLEINDAEKNL